MKKHLIASGRWVFENDGPMTRRELSLVMRLSTILWLRALTARAAY
jgi:hypothetical protein